MLSTRRREKRFDKEPSTWTISENEDDLRGRKVEELKNFEDLENAQEDPHSLQNTVEEELGPAERIKSKTGDNQRVDVFNCLDTTTGEGETAIGINYEGETYVAHLSNEVDQYTAGRMAENIYEDLGDGSTVEEALEKREASYVRGREDTLAPTS